MKCPKCGYEWQPRVQQPKACPRCTHKLTPLPKKQLPKRSCTRCGYEWVPKKEDTRFCPNCKQRLDKPPTKLYEVTCRYCGETYQSRVPPEQRAFCKICGRRLGSRTGLIMATGLGYEDPEEWRKKVLERWKKSMAESS